MIRRSWWIEFLMLWESIEHFGLKRASKCSKQLNIDNYLQSFIQTSTNFSAIFFSTGKELDRKAVLEVCEWVCSRTF